MPKNRYIDEKEKINGGAFQIARKIFESDLWLWKPASWKIVWIYILGKVNHESKKGFERGEGYFNFSEEIRRIGNDITYNNIREFLRWSRMNKMINTKRTTRGIRLQVLNYNKYQTLNNYKNTTQNTTQNTSQTQAKHTDKQE